MITGPAAVPFQRLLPAGKEAGQAREGNGASEFLIGLKNLGGRGATTVPELLFRVPQSVSEAHVVFLNKERL
jgi:hypothetical protein